MISGGFVLVCGGSCMQARTYLCASLRASLCVSACNPDCVQTVGTLFTKMKYLAALQNQQTGYLLVSDVAIVFCF